MLTGVVIAGVLLPRHHVVVDLAASATSPRPFIVYDATLYTNKPDLRLFGVHPITVWYESQMFMANQSSTAMPVEQLVRSLARNWNESFGPVVVDIERWPITDADPATIQSTVAKFIQVLSWIRSEAPGLSVGVYGTVPIYDYWRAASAPMGPHFLAWQADNDRLALITDHVDALYPSIYTFYPDRQAWVAYARAQIAEARRFAKGKPVYAFLWPQYHEANPTLASQPVEPDYWALQLATMAQYADGVVLWGGWGKQGPEPWNEDAPWWQITKRFVQELDRIPPSPPTDLRVQ
jgi:hypothetical protein